MVYISLISLDDVVGGCCRAMEGRDSSSLTVGNGIVGTPSLGVSGYGLEEGKEQTGDKA